MKKMLAIFFVVLIQTGCTADKKPALVSYERSEKAVKTYRTFSNTVYYPTLKTDNVLDLELIDEAKGFYIIENPTQKAVNILIEKGNTVYCNENGEVIVCIE